MKGTIAIALSFFRKKPGVKTMRRISEYEDEGPRASSVPMWLVFAGAAILAIAIIAMLFGPSPTPTDRTGATAPTTMSPATPKAPAPGPTPTPR